MIKLMIHTTVSRADVNGNRYSVTSYYTPASRAAFLITGREWGDNYSNARAHALNAGLTHEEIHQTINDMQPIREFNRMAYYQNADNPTDEEIVSAIKKHTQTEEKAA